MWCLTPLNLCCHLQGCHLWDHLWSRGWLLRVYPSYPHLSLPPRSSSGRTPLYFDRRLQSFCCVCLSSWKCDWHLAHWMKWGKGWEIKQKTESSLLDNTPSSHSSPRNPPLPTFTALLLLLFPSSFQSCHSLLFSLSHKIRFDSKSPQARQMTDNPSQFYH